MPVRSSIAPHHERLATFSSDETAVCLRAALLVGATPWDLVRRRRQDAVLRLISHGRGRGRSRLQGSHRVQPGGLRAPTPARYSSTHHLHGLRHIADKADSTPRALSLVCSSGPRVPTPARSSITHHHARFALLSRTRPLEPQGSPVQRRQSALPRRLLLMAGRCSGIAGSAP